MVPRQINYHDCGLCMLTYIEFFLLDEKKLKADMGEIKNRIHLNLFPRSLIFEMRDELRSLFYKLTTKKNNKIGK